MTQAPSAAHEAAHFRHSHVAVDGSSIHVVEAGDPNGVPFLFLHGWPESWRSWHDVMALAGPRVRAIAIDLPGIGESTGDATDGRKSQLAEKIHRLMATMKLENAVLVGHDVGGMIVYAYYRRYRDIRSAVIMNIPLPGVPPWDDFLRNPQIWHVAFHSVPLLPERLVQGRQSEYFDYFYDVLSVDPAKVTPAARDAHARAYATDRALTAGFNWYRAFDRDAQENAEPSGHELTTPLLYLRGDRERGADIATYVKGLEAAGALAVQHAVVTHSGHFTQDEAPAEVWRVIAAFAGLDVDDPTGTLRGVAASRR